MRPYTVTVYKRDGDVLFKENVSWFWLAKTINYIAQRVFRFPKYTTVTKEEYTNTVIHFKSDL